MEEITRQFFEAKERLNGVNANMNSLATLCKVIIRGKSSGDYYYYTAPHLPPPPQ
jgi:hypothetical protein